MEAGEGKECWKCWLVSQHAVSATSSFYHHSKVVIILNGFPGGSVVKNSPAKQEMWVQSLGWADPLKKEMATHSSILAWEILWTGEPGGL